MKFGIPPFYKVKEIFETVDNIIQSYDINFYADVSFADKMLVVGMIIKHQSKNKCTDWLDAFVNDSGPIFSDFLTTSNSESKINATNEIAEKLVSHHENLMEEIFNERIEHAETSKK